LSNGLGGGGGKIVVSLCEGGKKKEREGGGRTFLISKARRVGEPDLRLCLIAKRERRSKKRSRC